MHLISQTSVSSSIILGRFLNLCGAIILSHTIKMNLYYMPLKFKPIAHWSLYSPKMHRIKVNNQCLLNRIRFSDTHRSQTKRLIQEHPCGVNWPLLLTSYNVVLVFFFFNLPGHPVVLFAQRFQVALAFLMVPAPKAILKFNLQSHLYST